MSGPNLEERLMAILAMEDRFQRLNSIAELRKEAPIEIPRALIGLLNHSDEKVCTRAAHGLSGFRDFDDWATNRLCEHLRSNPSPAVRLSCAIKLMSVDNQVTDVAFVVALSDPFDKIAQVACAQLGFRAGTEITEALFACMGRPEWTVRLEACKALITQGTADYRVVDKLISIQDEPEAKDYDVQIEELEAMDASTFHCGDERAETWGNLNSILLQAKDLAGQ